MPSIREGQRRITVDADLVEGYDLATVMQEVETAVKSVDYPLGYHPEDSG